MLAFPRPRRASEYPNPGERASTPIRPNPSLLSRNLLWFLFFAYGSLTRLLLSQTAQAFPTLDSINQAGSQSLGGEQFPLRVSGSDITCPSQSLRRAYVQAVYLLPAPP